MNTSIPEILNPLEHSGTNRFERLGKEMNFDYVQIEERHEQDFLVHASKLAETIQYYDSNDMPSGNWKFFFDSATPESRPHKALFIAFLRLLEALNEHANGLTKRHLDFYYKEVLQFTAREVKPSRVHLFFKCAKTLQEKFLEKDAKLFAGQNKKGEDILFKLVDEIVVNKSEIVHHFSIYKHSDDFGNKLFSKDYSELILNPTDNINGYPAFGEAQLKSEKEGQGFSTELKSKKEQTMNEAEVGFAISSPLLRMNEGDRTIYLTIEYDLPKVNFDINLFNFSVTTEDGWFTWKSDSIQATTLLGPSKVALSLTLNCAPTDPGIVNYNSEIHTGNYQSIAPVLRIQLNHKYEETKKFAYTNWKNTTFNNVRLKVKATGVRTLIVQNELSTLDISKPFRPFGPIPTIGSHFFIGHSDVFKNELAYADVKLKWKALPSSDLENHYLNYATPPKNSDFLIQTATLENRNWMNVTDNVPLFNSDAKLEKTIGFNFNGFERKQDETTIETWDYTTSHGFVRMTLTQPDSIDFQAFGHSIYPKEVIRNNKLNPSLTINQPYSPIIESLTLDYETKEVTFFNSEEYSNGNEQDFFYHIEPFGQKNILLDRSKKYATLLPQYTFEGELYIGLKNVNPPQSVNLLFQLLEGSADANQSKISTDVQWLYLAKNEWKPIDRLRISKDTSRNLLNTGIIRFDLPKDIDSEHQVMPTGYFWLKAGIPEKSAGIDFIQSIHAQSVEAIEVNAKINDEVIAPNSISKLVDGNRGLAKITQPYASFDGAIPDNEEVYYARNTERLRHKDRGIMIWDYERLVIDSFPQLYKVKCLNHTNYQTEVAPGHVMIAVIPNLRNKGVQSPFQPKLSLHKRMDIYDFLRERISPFIYLRVENPIYEPIQLSFNVGFHQGYDEGFYGKKLHQQLQEFLSPWAFENELSEKSDLVFGGSLHKSTILKFIEELEYVDFVNDFNMLHIYQDPTIAAGFIDEIQNNTNYYASAKTSNPDTACDIIKMALHVENENELTSILEIKLRFLKGLLDLTDTELKQKFIKQLYKSIQRKLKKGEALTKTAIRIIVKNMFYVDKIVSLSFHKILPDGYIMEDVDVAIAKTSRSIMVTSEQHRIGVYRAGDYNCEGSVVIGIGFMIVEADFIIPEIKEKKYEYQAR
ncbi:MAG: hypothetical protein MK066_13695 [Crocinitomicaceae bacterium]|nr:hypothetical protein [Crocinitomicaceae bacterium]